MEFFSHTLAIPFMRQRYLAAGFSFLIFIASLFALFHHGLNLGLDFTGGTQIAVQLKAPTDLSALQTRLVNAGFAQASIRSYSATELSIRIAPHAELSQDALRAALIAAIPQAEIGQFDYIGPQVSQQLMSNGILAIIVALVGTMIYITLRFDYRFAASAAVALIHDPVLILGVFAYTHLEFNMIVLTAILTVIGYSLNDTIVVYDRIRENFRRLRKMTSPEVVDLSINQTLSRTIMTSGLTLIVVIALFYLGGETVHGFSLALIIGILVGTYSSIYIAGSLAIVFGLTRDNFLRKKEDDDSAP
jgi:preprotein translocase subunit SecF